MPKPNSKYITQLPKGPERWWRRFWRGYAASCLD